MESKKYVRYKASDTEYFGAQDVVEKEQEYIRQRRDLPAGAKIENLTGLALSGGGIRSASFSLGVMQALAHNGWLKKIDYLSTVSGGGYAGSSLSWLLSQEIETKIKGNEEEEEENGITRFGVEKKNFPYGAYPMSGAKPELRLSPTESEDSKTQKSGHTSERYKGKMLRYLRQQAKYLTPGDGITALSLVAVILRGALMSLFVYFGLLALAFVLLYPLLVHTPSEYGMTLPLADLNLALWLALVVSAVFIVLALGYSLGTYWWSRRKRDTIKPSSAGKQAGRAYRMRQRYERTAGRLLVMILTLAVLGAVPVVYEALQQALSNNASTLSDFEISGARAGDGDLQITGTIKAPVATEEEPSRLAALIGIFSTLFGALSGVTAFFKSSSGKKGRLPMGLVVSVGTAALWFGLLLIAYFIASELWCDYSGDSLIAIWLGAAIAISAVGHWANINYLSIHRYYRDRLMEAFMPDVDKVCDGAIATRAVTRADKAPIHGLFDANNGTGLATNPAPYHLINTNVVLESSEIPKFRGRGGDNFILTPYYCGSNATGWLPSSDFMDGRMTLPTAMAISGAAVNPSTGVGGQGVTRKPLLSMFMGLLNIRLGYWAPNPYSNSKSETDAETDAKAKAEAEARAQKRTKVIPNFFQPGLNEMFRRSKLNEKAKYVELTDGGHFENLALYELIRRRTRLIIVCDGGADADFQFTDFANAQEKIRADFGTLICCNCEDLQSLVPQTRADNNGCADDSGLKYAKRGYLLSKIIYPDNSQGRLLYIKTTFFEKLSADLYGYKKTHPQFPDEPTSDQFFDEMQFEAYRELGFQTAWEMMKDDKDVLNDDFVQAFLKRPHS